MDNASCIIVGVEATDARPSGEISSARKMIAECVTKLGLTPQTLAADTGYGKADFLAWLESQGIASYIPLRAALRFYIRQQALQLGPIHLSARVEQLRVP